MTPDQYWGLKIGLDFNSEIYTEKFKKSYYQQIQCFNCNIVMQALSDCDPRTNTKAPRGVQN